MAGAEPLLNEVAAELAGAKAVVASAVGVVAGVGAVAACACRENSSKAVRIPAATIATCTARRAMRRTTSCGTSCSHSTGTDRTETRSAHHPLPETPERTISASLPRSARAGQIVRSPPYSHIQCPGKGFTHRWLPRLAQPASSRQMGAGLGCGRSAVDKPPVNRGRVTNPRAVQFGVRGPRQQIGHGRQRGRRQRGAAAGGGQGSAPGRLDAQCGEGDDRRVEAVQPPIPARAARGEGGPPP